MKKLFTFAVSALLASVAWAGVITLDLNKPLNPTSLEFNDLGIWTECYNDVDYTWLEFGDENGEFMLSHLIDGEGASWGGYYWDGFCPAIGGDQTDYGQPGNSGTWTTCFGGCMAGGGCVINNDGSVTADPAQPYLVAYFSDWAMEGPSNQVTFVDKDGNTTFEPVGVYVCNHPWPYYGCEHGDGFGNPFAEGDYFELIAHGVAADGSETTVSINLVEFTDGQLIALNDWTFFDLSSLGEVVSVYFTMNSTDTGAYGMNTAAYFCMDKFQVKAEDEPVENPDLPGDIVFSEVDQATGKYTVTYQGPEEGVTVEVINVEPVRGEYTLPGYGTYAVTATAIKDGFNPIEKTVNLTWNVPDQVGAPTFVGYTEDGIYGYGVYIIPTTVGSNIMYRVFIEEDGQWVLVTDWTEYQGLPMEIWMNEEDAKYRVEAYAYIGEVKSNTVAYEYQVEPWTSINEMNAGKAIAGVRYFNMAGQEMQEANGLTIVVTTYTDGTTSAVKVVK